MTGPITRGNNLIFILSQPHAGSTLLQRVLGGHPHVHTVAEPWIMLHFIYALKDSGIKTDYDAATARRALHWFCTNLPNGSDTYLDAIRLAASFLYDGARSRSGKKYFVDKTPTYYLIIPELYRVFPEAKYVVLLRNPLAVLASLIVGARDYWPVFNEYQAHLLRAPHLLAAGVDVLGTNAIVVRYEELASKPAATVEALCARLGLRYVPTMLEYARTPVLEGDFADSGTHRYDRPVADPINKWIATLASPQGRHLGERYLRLLGPEILSRLGYSYEELDNALHSRPGGIGKAILSWDDVMKPAVERTTWDETRIRLVMGVQWGFRRTARSVVSKAIGRCRRLFGSPADVR